MTRAFFLISALVCGCSPFVEVVDVAKVSRTERAAAVNVQILNAGTQKPSQLTYVGPVQATSCKFLLWDAPASQADATEQLKIKARRLGADAVVDYACDESGADAFGTNCWSSVSCGGTAVKLSQN